MVSSNKPNHHDRRKSSRVDVLLPLEFDGAFGLTQNFSSSGLFFQTKQPVSLGESISLILKLEYWDPDHEALVRSQGKVVRVETGQDNFGEENFGVAVAIESYQFNGQEGSLG